MAFELIAEVDGGGSTTIDFTAIPDNYEVLVLEGAVRSVEAVAFTRAEVRMGTGSVDTAGNYTWFHMSHDTSNNQDAGASNSSTVYQFTMGSVPAASTGASRFMSFYLLIIDYADTSKYTHMMTPLAGVHPGAGASEFSASVGSWQGLTAVDTLQILNSGAANFASGSVVRLWGMGTAASTGGGGKPPNNPGGGGGPKPPKPPNPNKPPIPPGHNKRRRYRAMYRPEIR